MQEERLQKVISRAGVASRRQAEELILAGKVKVNEQVVTELGVKVSSRDKVKVDGKLIRRENPVYLLFYKPKGVITTTKDERGRKTVLDYLPHHLLLRETLPLYRSVSARPSQLPYAEVR